MPGTYNWRGTIGKNTLIFSFETGFDWSFSPTEDGSEVPPTISFYSYMGKLSNRSINIIIVKLLIRDSDGPPNL